MYPVTNKETFPWHPDLFDDIIATDEEIHSRLYSSSAAEVGEAYRDSLTSFSEDSLIQLRNKSYKVLDLCYQFPTLITNRYIQSV
jgi:hypothetical protein